jgi:thiamine biosynthesis lipoprotein
MAEYSGYTQGTTYHIICDSTSQGIDSEIEKLTRNLDHSISSRDSLSLVSKFNRSTAGVFVDQYFVDVLTLSKRIHDETEGAFNPAIYPISKLVMANDSTSKKTNTVDSLLRFTRFSDITLNGKPSDSLGKTSRFVAKRHPKNGLDFQGIAQGYTADVISMFLDSKNIANYMVQVGSISRTKGTDWHKKTWEISLDKPTPDGELRIIESIVPIGEKAVSITGDYRKSYEKDGKRFNTFIDPATGKMTENTLLNAYVFAPTAAEAEAYATAFMVMGAGKSTQFLSKRKELKAYLISSGFDQDFLTWISPELQKLIDQSK